MDQKMRDLVKNIEALRGISRLAKQVAVVDPDTLKVYFIMLRKERGTEKLYIPKLVKTQDGFLVVDND